MLTNPPIPSLSVLNLKAVGAFNQEKAQVGAFSVIVKTDCETDGSSAALNGVLLGDARHGESVAGDVLGGDEVEHHLVLLVGDRHQVDQAPERGAWTLADIEAEFHLGRKSSILAITINLQYVDIYPIIHFKTKRAML